MQVADAPERLAVTDGQLPTVAAVAEPGSQLVPWSGSGAVALPAAGGLVASAPAQIPHLFGEVDVVLPVLHGPYGEDGTIQGLLEMAGVPYVGAGVLASAVSMDKEYMNLIFTAKGLPVGPYVVVRERDWPGSVRPRSPAAADSVEAKRALDDIAELGWPLFVKPARGGSSIGTSKAHDLAQLHDAIATARQYDPKVLVEAAIDGVEVEVSVLEGIDGAPPDTSLPGQLLVDGGEEFWDFEAKYLDVRERDGDPGADPGQRDRGDPPARRGGVRRGVLRGPGPGRLLLHHRRPGPDQRDQHHAGPVAGLVFPEDVGGERECRSRSSIDRLLQTALKKRPGLR